MAWGDDAAELGFFFDTPFFFTAGFFSVGFFDAAGFCLTAGIGMSMPGIDMGIDIFE